MSRPPASRSASTPVEPDVGDDLVGPADLEDDPHAAPAAPRRRTAGDAADTHVRHVVTAVVVAHDGQRWLPRVLDGLDGQTRPPQRVVAVDTGSRDSSVRLLVERFGESSVVRLPRDTGFGAAAAEAIRAYRGAPDVPGGEIDWVWLLHDDSAPEAEALERLLDEAELSGAAVVGAKLRGWYDARLLLEVGFTVAGSGRRETGLERREHDQGQHDGVHDVLAVSSAGMLVRRDVWDALGGFDPNLRLFRDDLDFCWRARRAGHDVVVATDAVVHHAEAGALERRRLHATPDRPHYVDRRNAAFVVLTNRPLWQVPLLTVRLVVGGALRMLGFLLAKAPGYAVDELRAVLAVLLRPDRVIRGRLARRRTRTLGHGAVRHLLAPPGQQLRHAGEALVGVLSSSRADGALAGRHQALETGPSSEDSDELVVRSGGVARLLRRPGVLVAVVAALVTVVAVRHLVGSGRLLGGALLPAPAGAGDLWRTYTAAWHEVGVGSGAQAPPWLAVVAAVATVLLGKAPLAVDVLLLLAVPASAATAYLALRPAVRGRLLRAWAALAYALLPAMTGAVASGRLGTAVAMVLLPVVAAGAARTVGWPGRPGTFRAAFATGLALAVMTAFVPLAYPMAATLALVAAVVAVRGVGWLRLLAALAVPPLLLMPWTGAVLADPTLLLLEAGLPQVTAAPSRPEPLAIALLHPGGPGMYPVVISAGILLAGLAALLRGDRRRILWSAWAAVLVGLAAGVLTSRADVTAPTLTDPVPGWPGLPTALAGAGLLLAGAVGAEDARRRIRGKSFGWRQPAAVVVTVIAAVVPLAAAGWWAVRGAGGPLERRDPVLLPAFVAAAGQEPDAPRTLVLRQGAGGRLDYALLHDSGPRLGDAELLPPASATRRLDAVVADVASGRGGDAAARLADYAVRFVLVAAPVDPGLARALDALPGMTRVSTPGGDGLWKLTSTTGRARVVDGDGRTVAVLPTDGTGIRAAVAASDAGRRVVLADRHDAGWRATLDGVPLRASTYGGWAQAFDLPATGGRLVVVHRDAERAGWLRAEALALAVVVILALPGLRRNDVDTPPAHAATPAGPDPVTPEPSS